MATTLKLPFVRFVAQVNTAPAEPKANYQALAGRNALALQKCEWREAAKSAKATLVTHNFTVSHSGDQYDAYLMTGDYNAENSTEVAYAGMAAYRFTLPAAYISSSQTLVSMSLPVTRDRFLLPGVRVVAVLSDSAQPSASWATVRGDASPAASEAEYLKNSATRITAALDDSGTLELDLTGADATKKPYLWIYLTVEDYAATWTMYSKTEPRLYAIEGSAMIVSEDVTVTFSSDVTPDGNSYGCLDITTNEFTKWVDLTGDNVRCVYVEESGEGTVASMSLCGDVPASMSALPGWVVYDIDHGHVISFDGVSIDNTGVTYTTFSMSELLAFAARHGGVKGTKAHLVPSTDYSLANLYFDGLAACDFLQLKFKYNSATGVVTELACYWDESTSIYGGESVLRQGFGAFDADIIAPGAQLWRSGGVSFSDGSLPDLFCEVKGGSVGWCMIKGWSRRSGASLAVAGSFTSVGGVACDGMCEISYDSNDALVIERAYPLNLEFDTRENLAFRKAHSATGGAYLGLFVFGDFKTINNIRADGAAFVLAPESASLDPTAVDYVAPIWQNLVVPLRYKVAQPYFFSDIMLPFINLQGATGESRYPTHALMRGKVACLRHDNG